MVFRSAIFWGPFIFVFFSLHASEAGNAKRTFDTYLKNFQASPKLVEADIYSQRKPTLEYLDALIQLEFSRPFCSNEIGKDTAEIMALATTLKDDLGLAMGAFLKGNLDIEYNTALALENMLKAHAYFKETADSSGLLRTYYMLSVSHMDLPSNIKAQNLRFQNYFKAFQSIGQKMRNPQNRIFFIMRFLIFSRDFGDVLSDSLEQALIEEVSQLLSDSIVRPSLISDFHDFMGIYYSRNENFDAERALLHFQKSFDLLPEDCHEPYFVKFLNNIAFGYLQIEDYKNAEILYKQVVDIYQRHPNTPSKFFLQYAYSSLAELALKNENWLVAWEYRNLADSAKEFLIQHARHKHMEQLLFMQELEQRDSIIDQLYEKSRWKNLFILIFIVLLGIGLIMIFLLTFLNYKLKLAKNELQTMSDNQEIIMTMLAHDLRGPINTYQQLAETLLFLNETKQTDKQEIVKKQISLMGLGMTGLLENILQWGALKKKEKPMSIEILLKSTVQNILELYSPLANLNDVAIEVDIPEGLRLTIHPQTLETILRNLIDNAIKNSPKKGKVLIQWMQDNRTLKIVNDADPHFIEQLEAINQYFEAGTTKLEQKGRTGFGLQLVNLMAHRAQIKVKVSKGEHHRVVFRLLFPESP
jgi:signal transduction histidine kinase